MDNIQRIIKSRRFKVGDKVSWMQKYDGYEPMLKTGEIIAVHPHGFGAYYVVEHHVVVDFVLTMIYSTEALDPK